MRSRTRRNRSGSASALPPDRDVDAACRAGPASRAPPGPGSSRRPRGRPPRRAGPRCGCPPARPGSPAIGVTTVTQPFRASTSSPMPGIVPGGPLDVPLVVLPRQQCRVGIAELAEHAVGRLAVEVGLADRSPRGSRERARARSRTAAPAGRRRRRAELPLEKPAAGKAGHHRGGREDLPPSGHGEPRGGKALRDTVSKESVARKFRSGQPPERLGHPHSPAASAREAGLPRQPQGLQGQQAVQLPVVRAQRGEVRRHRRDVAPPHRAGQRGGRTRLQVGGRSPDQRQVEPSRDLRAGCRRRGRAARRRRRGRWCSWRRMPLRRDRPAFASAGMRTGGMPSEPPAPRPRRARARRPLRPRTPLRSAPAAVEGIGDRSGADGSEPSAGAGRAERRERARGRAVPTGGARV